MAREVVLSAVDGGWRGDVAGLPERKDAPVPSWQDAFHRAAVDALRSGAVVAPATFWVRSPGAYGHYLARRYASPSSWTSGVGVSSAGACAFAERGSSVAPPRDLRA